jgi:hypothetical protein
MTLLKKMALKASVDWEKYQEFQSGSLCPITQLPMNYTPGRIVCQINAKGIGKGLPSNFQLGIAVFDYSDSKEKYTLSRFAVSPYYWDYVLYRLGVVFTMADENTLLAVSDIGCTHPSIDRCEINISSAPSSEITFVSPYTYAGNEQTSQSTMRPPLGVGYNGELFYGVRASDSPYPSSNGWINKVSDSSFTTMSGSVCTGLSTTVRPSYLVEFLAMLGYDTPNKYVVTESNKNDRSTYCRYKLINCTGTPVAGSEVVYSGANTLGIIPISATKLVAGDFTTSGSYVGRLVLLYTNSATAPTTLTKGAECGLPDPPAGAGFTSSDVEYAYTFFGFYQCGNYKSKENKILAIITLADGDTNYHVYSTCIIESTSNSNITCTLPTEDVHGDPPTLLHHYTGHTYANYSIQVVGAPDNKAVMIWMNPDEDKIYQQTFQL